MKIIDKYSRKQRITSKVTESKLSYLEPEALQDLYEAVKYIESSRVPGKIIEAGCALGGSAIVICSAKKRARPFEVYDVFGMIPPPSESDGKDVQERYKVIASGESSGIGGDEYYGYQEDLLEKVRKTLKGYGFTQDTHKVQLIQGLYEDKLIVAPGDEVALAHIDCDWYDSVMVCLERIVPQLSVGGLLVIDDYHSWSGCKKAVDEYFEGKKDKFTFSDGKRLQIRRVK